MGDLRAARSAVRDDPAAGHDRRRDRLARAMLAWPPGGQRVFGQPIGCETSSSFIAVSVAVLVEGMQSCSMRESGRRLDRQGVDEGLREIAAHLMLTGVVFFAEQLRWSTCCAGPFVPCSRLDRLALLVQAERHEESAEQKRSFGIR